VGRSTGAFAALAFAKPGHYLGKALELAGDELTRQQIHNTLSRQFSKCRCTECISNPQLEAPRGCERSGESVNPKPRESRWPGRDERENATESNQVSYWKKDCAEDEASLTNVWLAVLCFGPRGNDMKSCYES
jgi:hypothetical protein